MSIIVEKMWIQLSGDLYASFSFLQCCFDGGFFFTFLLNLMGMIFVDSCFDFCFFLSYLVLTIWVEFC